LKLQLIGIGRMSESFLREGAEEYSARIRRYLPFSLLELKEEKGGGKNADLRNLREREGARILEKIPAEAYSIILDEQGVSLGSEALAELLAQHMLKGTPHLSWVIGGAWGLSEAVKRRGDLVLSLSAMTFTHQMARLFLLEQIYRALTIVRNEPYHNR
jgi:23S rRNA (pseudouridine1915-N3)-methyltransferase